jgi:hypothetical protein
MIIDVSITIDASIINTMVIIGTATPQRPPAAERGNYTAGRRGSRRYRWLVQGADRQ